MRPYFVIMIIIKSCSHSHFHWSFGCWVIHLLNEVKWIVKLRENKSKRVKLKCVLFCNWVAWEGIFVTLCFENLTGKKLLNGSSHHISLFSFGLFGWATIFSPKYKWRRYIAAHPYLSTPISPPSNQSEALFSYFLSSIKKWYIFR